MENVRRGIKNLLDGRDAMMGLMYGDVEIKKPSQCEQITAMGDLK
jgi:hypothetical protein